MMPVQCAKITIIQNMLIYCKIYGSRLQLVHCTRSERVTITSVICFTNANIHVIINKTNECHCVASYHPSYSLSVMTQSVTFTCLWYNLMHSMQTQVFVEFTELLSVLICLCIGLSHSVWAFICGINNVFGQFLASFLAIF